MKTPEEKKAIMLAVLNGARREYRMCNSSNEANWVTSGSNDLVWLWGAFDYRLAPEPKPKRRVPLTSDDLPVGPFWISFAYKSEYAPECWLVDFIGDRGLRKMGGQFMTFDFLQDSDQMWSVSRKGPWRPFWKEVE